MGNESDPLISKESKSEAQKAQETGADYIDQASEGIAGAADTANKYLGNGFKQSLCGCWTENIFPGGLLICCCPGVVTATLEANMQGRKAYCMEYCCPANPYTQRVAIRNKRGFITPNWQYVDALSAIFCTICFISQNVVEYADLEGKEPQWFHCPPNFGDDKEPAPGNMNIH